MSRAVCDLWQCGGGSIGSAAMGGVLFVGVLSSVRRADTEADYWAW